eukprot:m.6408 g.6408  ORF g.6408 m.6408 type:complete len:422 (-) comp3529_c0_seq1:22-1287(-)
MAYKMILVPVRQMVSMCPTLLRVEARAAYSTGAFAITRVDHFATNPSSVKYKNLMPMELEKDMQTVIESIVTKYSSLTEKRDSGEGQRNAKLNKEIGQLESFVIALEDFRQAQVQVNDLLPLLEDDDDDMINLARDELELAKEHERVAYQAMISSLVSKEGFEDGNAVLELRPGAGGRESALFNVELYKMYQIFSKKNGWKFEEANVSYNDEGGIRAAYVNISGRGVYGVMKHEAGVHRVQRVPDTETQGRVHTSTCIVSVFPEPTKSELPDIREGDLKIDTFKASGAGGQHVNTTDSAVRITHLPTNTVVECSSERSQHQNKYQAMKILRARIFAQIRQQEELERKAEHQRLMGDISGDRSDRIRTYNFPQDRVTDHRCSISSSINPVFQGELEEFHDSLEIMDRETRLKQILSKFQNRD